MDMWLPEGTNIYETDRIADEMADYVRGHERSGNGFQLHRPHTAAVLFVQYSFRATVQYAQLLIKCHTSKMR